ncbi:hypothetical protein [Pyrodictium delaneyi]|uniref:Uncharacterized protein n=1 Tax=Pyrodictium delaneyi TaxID=1273541 RepID=A0A211YM55_9CREN|nr:hypothetical protein [Pyrodictium delaneyi]OWJ53907.1 hypothetical protein Pdsh_08435 [Pyrodictium delaneyi]
MIDSSKASYLAYRRLCQRGRVTTGPRTGSVDIDCNHVDKGAKEQCKGSFDHVLVKPWNGEENQIENVAD